MSSICLALATSFSQGLFSIRRRVIWAIWLVYDIFHVSTSENQSKIKPGFCHMEIHHPNVYLASWVCLLTCLFRRTHFLCWVFLHLVELVYFGFILVLGAIFEAIYWHSFPQRRFLGKMVNHHQPTSTQPHWPTTTTTPVEFEPPLSCHVIYPLLQPIGTRNYPLVN